MQGLVDEPFPALVTNKLVYPYGHVMCTFRATMRVVHLDAQDQQNKQKMSRSAICC